MIMGAEELSSSWNKRPKAVEQSGIRQQRKSVTMPISKHAMQYNKVELTRVSQSKLSYVVEPISSPS